MKQDVEVVLHGSPEDLRSHGYRDEDGPLADRLARAIESLGAKSLRDVSIEVLSEDTGSGSMFSPDYIYGIRVTLKEGS